MFSDVDLGFTKEALKGLVVGQVPVELSDGARDARSVCEPQMVSHGTLSHTAVFNQKLHQDGARLALSAPAVELIPCDPAHLAHGRPKRCVRCDKRQ